VGWRSVGPIDRKEGDNMSTAPSGWQNPKMNWGSPDVPLPPDFNRIESNINAIEQGARTLDPSQAPTGNQGTLRQILSWFANRIRAITGTTNWYDAPPATLSGLNTSLNAHKSTSPLDHPDGSVTAAKIASGAVGTTQLANNAVTSSKIATGAVIAGKLADGAVDTLARIASNIRTTPGGTEANRIAVTDDDGAVGLARDAVLVKGRDFSALIDYLYLSAWESRSSGTSQELRGIAYGDGMWVAVGNSGTILTSPNGVTWTSRTSGVSGALNGVAYGGGMWVAVGGIGRILTSTDGISWTLRPSGTEQSLRGIAYGDGMWVTVGNGGAIIGTVPM